MSLYNFLAGVFGAGIAGNLYTGQKPAILLEDFFDGPIKAWGVIQDRRNNVVSRFSAEMFGRWKNGKGILEEKFVYYDSDLRQVRTWEITKIADGHYEGRAGDILGIAKGRAFGSAMRWRYTMDIPVDDTHYRLSFDDWMWAMHDGVVINRSSMKKFGLTVAELTVFMQKQTQ